MENVKKYPGQLVFGLDIGTRSIVGTVGYRQDEDHFVVVAQCGKEHTTRAMLDGQIHDIGRVGNTIREVKERLEEKLDRKLEKVCIAAAGRVLKTIQVHTDMNLDTERVVTQEDVLTLNSKATEEAYKEFLKNSDAEVRFYCVGSSVVRYYLNDFQMSNLVDHKAKKISVDMIATFLPDDVVDGLYKAVEHAGLSVASLTLEPIAAIELAIPEKFRLLNIGLVDVGAGTSDISITKEGTITAFGMIPTAGDSLTEPIALHCMVDFNTAEQIKRDAGEMEIVTYEDIMGLKQQISSQEIEGLLAPLVERMTDEVAAKILELNGDKSVGAVFVVGGGGKIPGYTKALAAKLNLAPERVAIRGKEVMQNIIFEDTEMEQNSLLVTPIGICLDYYKENHNFIHVSFNDTSVKLYNNNKLTVMDAAMQTDFPSTDLFPKSGQKLTFTVNGKERFVRGEMGEAAVILLNDQIANLHTPIKENDIIKVAESTGGAPGRMFLEKLPEYKTQMDVFVNGTKVTIPKFPTVNGNLITGSYEICEGDVIEFLDYVTIDQIRTFMDIVVEKGSVCMVNNKEADSTTKVFENFEVVWKLSDKPQEEWLDEGEDEAEDSVMEEDSIDDVSVDEVLDEALEETETVPVTSVVGTASVEPVQPQNIEHVAPQQTVETSVTQKVEENTITENTVSGEAGEEEPAVPAEPRDIYVIVNGNAVLMKGKTTYVFVDIFNFINFDLSKPQGTIVTTVNGHSANYMEELHEGDKLEIYWRKM